MDLKSSFLHIKLLLIVFLLSGCSAKFSVQKSERALITINNAIESDQHLTSLIAPYKINLDAEMNRVIAKSAHALVKRSPVFESTLGNFFADACLQQARLLNPSIDFAMPSTSGGMRIDLPAGNLILSNIYELMPFENELIVVDIKGSEIMQLVAFILKTGGQPIAGLQIKYKNNTATEVLIKGKPVETEKIYKMLTSDYILGGGDSVQGISNVSNKQVLGLKVRDALVNYLKQETAAGREINVILDGRVKEN